MKKRLFVSIIVLLTMNCIHAQMTCNKVTGNYVNNYDFEVLDYVPTSGCSDFPTICGSDFCEWYRAFGKPNAAMLPWGSTVMSNGIAIEDMEGDFICGIYQNNFILPLNEYQGHIEIEGDDSPLGQSDYIDKIIVGLTSGLDQNDVSTKYIRETQLPPHTVLATFLNVPLPVGDYNILQFEFSMSSQSNYDQLFIYSVTTSQTGDALFFLDNVVIKKKLYANAGEDKTVCKGLPVTLGGLAPSTTAIDGMPNYQYFWHCSTSSWSSTEENPVLIPETTTTYYLTVKDEGGNGNTATDQVTITVDNNCPCLYPVYIDGAANYVDGLYKNNAFDGNISIKATTLGGVAVLGRLESNVLTISNGYTLTHPLSGSKQFICKFNNKGYTQWARVLTPGYSPHWSHGVLCDEDNTFLALKISNSLVFENGESLTNASGVYSIGLVCFDKIGKIAWKLVLDNKELYDMVLSDDGVYIVGSSPSNFILNGLQFVAGNFIIKLNKAGGFQWCVQPPQPGWNSMFPVLAIKDNIPFIQCTPYDKVVQLDPSSGNFFKQYTKSINSNESILSFSYGGSGMFYDFQVADMVNYPSNYALKGFKLEATPTSGGKEIFNFQKSIEAPMRYALGCNSIDNMVYMLKGTYPEYNPESFLKENMTKNSSPTIIWNKSIPTLSGLQTALKKNLPYGYYWAYDYTHNNDYILNQFSLQTNNFGCMVNKNVEQDLTLEESKSNVNDVFTIYPNPADEVLNILKSGKADLSLVFLKCYNSMGGEVIDQEISVNCSNEITINISKLSSGLYYLLIYEKDNSFSQTIKFIKK